MLRRLSNSGRSVACITTITNVAAHQARSSGAFWSIPRWAASTSRNSTVPTINSIAGTP